MQLRQSARPFRRLTKGILELQSELFDGVDGPENVNVIVFARNWNVFRFREGLGGLAFAN